jgi:hypothetical protein
MAQIDTKKELIPQELQNLTKPFAGLSAHFEKLPNSQKATFKDSFAICTVGDKIHYIGCTRPADDSRKRFLNLIQIFNASTNQWEEDIQIKGWAPGDCWQPIAFASEIGCFTVRAGSKWFKLDLPNRKWDDVPLNLVFRQDSDEVAHFEMEPGTQILPRWDGETLHFTDVAKVEPIKADSSSDESSDDDEDVDVEEDDTPVAKVEPIKAKSANDESIDDGEDVDVAEADDTPDDVFSWGDVPYGAHNMWTFYVGKTILTCSTHIKQKDMFFVHIHDTTRKNWIKLSEFPFPYHDLQQKILGIYRVGCCIFVLKRTESKSLQVHQFNFVDGTAVSIPITTALEMSRPTLVRVGNAVYLRNEEADTDAVYALRFTDAVRFTPSSSSSFVLRTDPVF